MRGKASLASRLLCVVFLLLFSRTAATASIQENWPQWMKNFKDY